jgi:hypothetical protein
MSEDCSKCRKGANDSKIPCKIQIQEFIDANEPDPDIRSIIQEYLILKETKLRTYSRNNLPDIQHIINAEANHIKEHRLASWDFHVAKLKEETTGVKPVERRQNREKNND